jgi:hypothetical protein
MARYVHPEVQDLLESPDEEGSVRLALVVNDGSVTEVRDEVHDLGGTVERQLPSGVLLVTVPLAQLPALCDVQDIESISPDEQMEVLV